MGKTISLGFIEPDKLEGHNFTVLTRTYGSKQEALTLTETLDEALNFIFSYLYENNLDNGLTDDAKMENWQVAFPVFMKNGKIDKNMLYAGTTTIGNHLVSKINEDGEIITEELTDDLKSRMRFFMGKELQQKGKNIMALTSEYAEDGYWYVQDMRTKQPIVDFDSYLLQNKTILGVHKIGDEDKIVKELD